MRFFTRCDPKKYTQAMNGIHNMATPAMLKKSAWNRSIGKSDIPYHSLAPVFMIWMPFIACVYFFGSHLVKKRMLKTHGYFAC